MAKLKHSLMHTMHKVKMQVFVDSNFWKNGKMIFLCFKILGCYKSSPLKQNLVPRFKKSQELKRLGELGLDFEFEKLPLNKEIFLAWVVEPKDGNYPIMLQQVMVNRKHTQNSG